MEIKSIISNAVRVQVERRIAIDQTLRINPSEAWLGIESGVITIVAIGTISELTQSITEGEVLEALHAEHGVMIDNLDDYEFNKDVRERLDTQPWVVYRYTSGEVASLPLEEFVDHTMHY